jgi:hypothetical protein
MVRGDKKCNYFVVVSNLRCCVHRFGDIFCIDELGPATFSDNLFDRAIALDERLNAMIDRAIKRLIHIKAMKQMLGHTPKKPKAEVIKLPERKSSVRQKIG